MAREITQGEWRDESAAIMRSVDAGDSFVVTRNGDQVAELSPLHPRGFVPTVTAIEHFRDAPHIDYDRFRADLASLWRRCSGRQHATSAERLRDRATDSTRLDT